YMAGDNNLADEMISSLQSVENTNIAEGLTWRVLFDTGERPLKEKTIVGSGKKVMAFPNQHRRLKLQDAPEFKVSHKKSQPPTAPGAPPKPEKYEEVTAQRVRDILQAFVRDTVIEHPADHYMLILSGHGSGAVGDFLGSNRRSSNLSIRDIGKVLTNVDDDL